MKEIRGNAKSLRKLLANTKFAIDYYQREYRWQTKQVAELIEDLAGIFLDHFTTGDAQKDVKFYGHYFLGSVIVSKKAGRRFIIDGQQRLTTLTLLLVHLYRNLPSSPQKEQLGSLIYLELSRFHGRLVSVVDRLRFFSFRPLSGARERTSVRAAGAPQAAWFLS